jgi:site-specific DNA-cytosine methylase
MMPLCVDLFCGLGGWAEGFLAEGYRCIGYDIEAHDYGTGGYPGTLILRDVRSIHGSELKDAAVIVASPPCQAYSYRAMPWKRAKALPPPDNTLFNECFRIQREASEAAGHYIPLIVENVRGAQKWVGRARWNYGSFYLWGDVPALMPMTFKALKWGDCNGKRFDERPKGNVAAHREGRKVSMNFHEHEKTGRPGRSFQSAAVAEMGTKQGGDWFGKNCESSMSRMYGSKSPKRKAASAMIAKIPYPLALHIARTFKPRIEAIA